MEHVRTRSNYQSLHRHTLWLREIVVLGKAIWNKNISNPVPVVFFFFLQIKLFFLEKHAISLYHCPYTTYRIVQKTFPFIFKNIFRKNKYFLFFALWKQLMMSDFHSNNHFQTLYYSAWEVNPNSSFVDLQIFLAL